MPKPRAVANAFPPKKAAAIVGLSIHMLNYLARAGYLVPTYVRSGRRGKTRFYSFRDLVIARVVQRLLAAGLEISRLKEGIKKLPSLDAWAAQDPDKTVRMLASDGTSLFFLEEDGTVLDLTQQGQLTFAFVVDVAAAQAEVKRELTPEQLQHFSLRNRRIKYTKVAGR